MTGTDAQGKDAAGEALIVALHGNPGRGADLERLGEALGGPGRTWLAPTRPKGGVPLPELLAELERQIAERDPARLLVLGYSWGAWLALTHLRRSPRKPEAVALVCPYLVVESPLGALPRLLLATPGLGRFLLKRAMQGTIDKYVRDTFAPETPAPEVEARMRERLADLGMWRGAVRYKLLQQAAPLPELRQPPARLLVVRGAEDAVGGWATQGAPLAGLGGDQLAEHVVDAAGHGLPWTHTEEVAQRVEAFFFPSDPEAEDAP